MSAKRELRSILDKALRVAVSVSLVMGLVPAPALAEAVDEALAEPMEEVVVADQPAGDVDDMVADRPAEDLAVSEGESDEALVTPEAGETVESDSETAPVGNEPSGNDALGEATGSGEAETDETAEGIDGAIEDQGSIPGDVESGLEDEGGLPGGEEDLPEDGTTVLADVPEPVELSLGADDEGEDLVGSYIEQRLSEQLPGSTGLRKARSASSRLTGNDAIVYGILRDKVVQVAAGSLASTVFEIDPVDICGKASWTADELGVESIVDASGSSISSEASAKLYEKIDYDYRTVLRALLADCPYELYWYDKTEGTSFGWPSIHGTYEDGEWHLIFNEGSSVTVSMRVSADYSATGAAGTFDVDTTTGARVSAAVSNAASVAAEGAELSAYDRLAYYKDAICNLTSYNHAAADNDDTPYGDPWQLIYVFDGYDGDDTPVVCEGYSKAFKYLCDLSGASDVSCIAASGTMDGGTGAGNHMWNVVTMDDGLNYLVDVTNCDEGTVGQLDALFLVPCSSGSVDGGYVFDANGQSISYAYDSGTLSLYGASELEIASESYAAPGQPDEGIDIHDFEYRAADTWVASDGQPHQPSITLVLNPYGDNEYLTEGVHYEFLYFLDELGNQFADAPSDPGEYYAVYGGISPYSGELRVAFTIFDTHDLQYGSLSLDDGVYVHTGEPVAIVPHVTDYNGKELSEGDDFHLDYGSWQWDEDLEQNVWVSLDYVPSDDGNYRVRAVGDGAYRGVTLDTQFYITQATSLTHGYITIDRAVAVNGACDIELAVYDSQGNQVPEGSYELQFFRDETSPSGGELVPIDGYPTVAGDYAVMAVATAEPYSGSTSHYSFHVDDEHTLTTGRIELDQDTFVANGEPVSLSPHVYDATGRELVLDEDYEFAYWFSGEQGEFYEAPTEPGEYQVMYRGIGDYYDIIDCHFYINEAQSENTHTISLDEYIDVVVYESDNWIGRFTAPQDGFYIFQSEGDWDTVAALYEDEGLTQWLASDDNSQDGLNFRLSVTLTEGQTVYLVVGASDGLGCECGVYVNYSDPYDLFNGSFDWEGATRLPFTGDPVSPVLSVYDSMGMLLDEGIHFTIVYFDWYGNELDGPPSNVGSYFVRAMAIDGSGYTGGSPSVSFDIYEPVDAVEMTVGSTSAVAQEGSYWLGVFTAAKAGTYTFESEGEEYDTYGELYSDIDLSDELAIDDDGAGYPNFRIEYWLDAGQTVYLKVRQFGNGYMDTVVNVSVYDPFDLANCSLWGGEKTFDVEFTGSPVWPRVFVRDASWNTVPASAYELVFFDVYGTELETAPSQIGRYNIAARAVEGSEYSGETSWVPFAIYDLASLESGNVYLQNYDYYDWDSDSPCYFWNAGSTTPKVNVYNYRGQLLEEGVDYIVGVSGAEERPDTRSTALLTVTGINDYHGEKTVEFTVLGSLPIDEYFSQGEGIVVSWDQTRFYANWDVAEFLADGWPIRPAITHETYQSMTTVPCQGVDYTLAYTNSDGAEVTPKETGEYQIVLSGIDGGLLTGTMSVPFSIVDTVDLPSHDVSFDVDGSSYSLSWGTLVRDALDDLSDLVWSIRSSSKVLVENLDFAVSYVRDVVYGFFAVTLTGIGSYTGSIRGIVYVPDTQQEAFSRLVVRNSVYDGNQGPSVRVDEEGSVSFWTAPGLANLVEGLDYILGGFFDADGNPVDVTTVRDAVYMKYVGIGKYEGCERLVEVAVNDGGPIDLASDKVDIRLRNGWEDDSTGEKEFFLFASDEPEVLVRPRGAYNLWLSEGQGFDVSAERTQDGSAFSVTVTANDSGFFVGSRTFTVNLVESRDINSILGDRNIYVYGFGGQQFSTSYDGRSVLRLGDEARLTYAGFPYMPTVGFGHPGDVTPTIHTTLFDSASSQVDQISSGGSYTLHVEGTGNWTGAIDIPVAVTENTDGLSVSKCDLIVGAAPLVDGVSEPTVKLSYGENVFEQGVDYNVEYGNNGVEGAHAWVRVTAVEGGRLYGTRSVGFVVGQAGENLSANYTLDFIYPSTGHTTQNGVTAVGPYTVGGDMPEVVLLERFSGRVLDPSNYDVEYLNADTTGLAYVKVTGKGDFTGSLTRNFYVVDVAVPTLYAVASTSPVRAGATATFSVSVEGADPDACEYQWQYQSGVGSRWTTPTAATARAASYRVGASRARLDAAWLFRCTVTAPDGRTVTTEPIGFEELPSISATVTTLPAIIGGNATFGCSVSNYEGEGLTYKWQYTYDGVSFGSASGVAVGSATGPTLTVNVTASRVAGMSVRCIVTAPDGRTATTEAIGFEVLQLPELTAYVTTEQVTVGEDATFTCQVEGYDDDSELTYKWQYTYDGVSFGGVAGIGVAAGPTLTVNATARRVAGMSVRCIVTAPDGRTATTEPVGFDAVPALAATVSTEPVYVDDDAVFTCVVEGNSGDDLTYSWQYSYNGGPFVEAGEPGPDATLTIKATATRVAGMLVRCVVSAPDGRGVTTEAVPFEVLLSAAVSSSPVDLGASQVLSCVVDGVDQSLCAFTWQLKAGTDAEWQDVHGYDVSIEGYDEASMTWPEVGSWCLDYEFRCVTSALGKEFVSEPVSIELNDLSASIAAVATVAVGDPFKVACTIESGVARGYAEAQWYVSDDDGASWSPDWDGSHEWNWDSTGLTNVLVDSQPIEGRLYYCVITDSCGRTYETEPVELEQDGALVPLPTEMRLINDSATLYLTDRAETDHDVLLGIYHREDMLPMRSAVRGVLNAVSTTFGLTQGGEEPGDQLIGTVLLHVQEGVTEYEVPLRSFMDETGSYYVLAKVVQEGENPASVDFGFGREGKSTPIDYTRPEEALEVPTNVRWSNEQFGLAQWDAVDGASRYEVHLYRGDQLLSPMVLEDTAIDLLGLIDVDAVGEESYTFTVTAISDDAYAVACSEESARSSVLGVTDDGFVEMALGVPSDATVDDDVYWYGKYTVRESGTYSFFGTGCNTPEAVLYSDPECTDVLKFTAYNSMFAVRELEAGDTVYLRVRDSFRGNPVTIQVSVIKGIPFDRLDSYVLNDWLPIESAGSLEAIFHDYSKGYPYSLSLGTDYVLDHYESEDGTVIDGTPAEAGKYYACYEGTGVYVGQQRLLFTLFDEASIPQISVGGEPVRFESPDSSVWVCKFTASEAGPYEIVLHEDSEQDVAGWLYSDAALSDMIKDGSTNTSGVLRLAHVYAAGDTVYVKVMSGLLGRSTQGTVSVEPQTIPEGLMELTSAESMPVELDADTQEWRGYFEAPTSGTYTFYSTGATEDGSPEIELYDDSSFTSIVDFGGETEEYDCRLYYRLVAGQRIFIKVHDYYGQGRAMSLGLGVEYIDTSDLSQGSVLFEHWRTRYSPNESVAHYFEGIYDSVGNRVPASAYTLVYSRFDEVLAQYVDIDGVPSSIGSYGVRAIAVDGGGYTSETPVFLFEIVDPNDLSGANMRIRTHSFEENSEGVPVAVSAEVQNIDGVELAEGIDYDLVYYDENYVELEGAPSVAGTYYVRAAGKDPYYGYADYCWFEITGQNSLNASHLSVEATYWCNDIDGCMFEWNHEVVDWYGSQLLEGTDYVLQYFDADMNPVDGIDDAGVYWLRAVPAEGSNYFGVTPYKSLYVPNRDESDLAYGYAEFPSDYIACTGAPVELDCTVHLYDGTELTEADYEIVRYEDYDGKDLGSTAPVEAGEYYVVIQGINGYSGQKRIYFHVINASDLSNGILSLTNGRRFAYTGDPVPIGCEVLDGMGNTLVEGLHYYIEYWDANWEYSTTDVPTQVGIYHMQVIATGEGGYTGSADTSFEIYDSSLQGDIPIDSGADWNCDAYQFYYDGEGHAPHVTEAITYVYDDEAGERMAWLSEGTDFVLARYEDAETGENLGTNSPIGIGTYVAVYEGRGAYYGEKLIDFSIVEMHIETLEPNTEMTYTIGADRRWNAVVDVPSDNPLVVVEVAPANGEWADAQLYADVSLSERYVSTDTTYAPACVTYRPGPGQMYVSVLGYIPGHTGTVKVRFLYPDGEVDLQSEAFTATLPNNAFTSEELEARIGEITLEGPDGLLVPGADYVIAGYVGRGMDETWYGDTTPTHSGHYDAVLVGTGEYYGVRRVRFHLVDDLVAGTPVAAIADCGDSWIGRYVAQKSGTHTFLAEGCNDMVSFFMFKNLDAGALFWREAMWEEDTDWQNLTLTKELNAGDVVYVVLAGDNEINANVTVTEPEA